MNAPFPARQFDAATTASLRLFAFFHLNLAFSSIEEAQRGEVIARCYWPLLRLAEKHPIGIEASGFTLEEIEKRDPKWIAALKRLIGEGRVEFIGAGYSQMIGPLVPWRVTAANLALGNEIYARLLGARPKIALVNEQAYSCGLVGLYLDAGYKALLMDWDNPSSHHQWPPEMAFRPQRAIGSDGRAIALLWTNTVAFQKLQRHVHGDIGSDEYLSYIRAQRDRRRRALCVYASDAEIFDFRPGRYKTEEKLTGREWQALDDVFALLAAEPGMALVLPSRLLPEAIRSQPVRLETSECPIPVKKQRKYNLSRWAVTGRDDIAVNAACERLYRRLATANAPLADWKELCFLWASDFRTHITEKRWNDFCERLKAANEPLAPPPLPPTHGKAVEARVIDIETSALKAQLDRRRGLAFKTLSFGGPALAGMLPHGTFQDIALQADWYTGNCVFEAPGEHKVTDLEWCETQLWSDNSDILAHGRIETPKGLIEKTLRFHANTPRVDFDITFHWTDWGKGSLRLGHVTLLPGAFDLPKLSLRTHNGGKDFETFRLHGRTVDHGAPVSFLVSSSHGIGMTEGIAEIGDDTRGLRIEVDRSTAPLLGLVTHKAVRGGLFCQIALSALELDDTRKPAAYRAGPRRFRFSFSAAV
jgi:hypothetical protein